MTHTRIRPLRSRLVRTRLVRTRLAPLCGLLLAAGIVPGAMAAASAPAAASGPAPAASAPALAALPGLDALASPTLPPLPALRALLLDAPGLREAQSMQQAAQHDAAALRAGSQEFTAQAQLQQRRIDTAPDAGRYNEWQILVNRPLRLPSQAGADARQAAATVSVADAALDAARRDLLQGLLQSWFEAGSAQAEAALAQRNVDALQQQLHAVQRRQQLGDASVLELEQLQAEAARAESALLQARGRAEAARAGLLARYPQLGADAGLEGPPALLDLPAQPRAELAELAASHSAALAQARAALRQAQAAAEQAHAARTPQPTVGAYVGQDRGGNEHIVGLQFAMPFGGPARVERERSALAGLDAARWALRDAETRQADTFARLYASARAQSAGAQALDQAAQAQLRASARMQRAWQLGEAGLAEWLLARRGAVDMLQQAQQARFAAAQALALLRLHTGLLALPSAEAAPATPTITSAAAR